MKSVIKIFEITSINIPEISFSLAFVTFALIVLFLGYKKKLPFIPLMLILATAIVLAIFGGKFLAYSAADWTSLFENLVLPYSNKKTILGYLLFGLIGIQLTKYLLGFKYDLAEIIAFAWPASFIVARLGCFFSGCCHGITTNGSLGVQYSNNFPAHIHQANSGLIDRMDVLSLPVYPTQLYEIAICVVLLTVLYIIRKRKFFKKGFSYAGFSIIFYGFFRFFMDFIRVGGSEYAGLKITQWVVLFLMIGLVIALIFIERSTVNVSKEVTGSLDPKRHTPFMLGIGLLFLIRGSILGFSGLEIGILKVVFYTICAVLIIHISNLARQSFKIRAALGSVLMLFIFSSQQVLEDSKKESVRRFFEIKGAGTIGQEVDVCGGISKYNTFGVGVAYHLKKDAYTDFSFGSDFYHMKYNSNSAFGLSPYVSYDSRIVGISGGINYGDYWSNGRDDDLVPTASLRIGRLNNFFVDGHYNNFFPGGMPTIQLGVGFGMDNNYNNDIDYVRVGLADNGFYVNPRFHIGQKTVLNPYVAFGGDSNFQATLALHFMLE